jgi:hypothetical protein
VDANSIAFCYFGLRLKRTKRCRRSTVTHVSEDFTAEVIWIEENTTVLSRKLLFIFPQSDELFSTVYYVLQVNIQCLITETFTLNCNPSFKRMNYLIIFKLLPPFPDELRLPRRRTYRHPLRSTDRVLPQKPNETIPDVGPFFIPTANRADLIY